MQLLSYLQQFDIEPIDFLTTIGTCGLLLFLVLASFCLPVLALTAESAYLARRKAFYDKIALQVSQAAFGLFLFIFVLLGCGSSVFLYLYFPSFLEPPVLWNCVAAVALPALSLFAFTIYFCTFGALKKKRAAHQVIGWPAALLFLFMLFCCLLLIGPVLQPLLFSLFLSAPLAVLHVLLLFFISEPLLWLLLGDMLSAGLASGAGLALLWLIMRRAKADYGRDYYAFAMRYLARIALFFALAMEGFMGGILWRIMNAKHPELGQQPDPAILLIVFGLPFSCCLLWFSIVKSATPMRHKPGAFFACLFMIIGLCSQLLLFFTISPMP